MPDSGSPLPAASLRALMVEDSRDDAALVQRALRSGGFDLAVQRVETAEEMQAALETQAWDVVLCDYTMPGFGAPQALALLQATGKDIPLIVVSGTIGEEAAVETMKAGAADYVMEGNLPRLPQAIRREIQDADGRRERRRAEEAMRASERFALATLNGLSASIAILDDDGKILAVNEAWRRFATENTPPGLNVAEGMNYLWICDATVGHYG